MADDWDNFEEKIDQAICELMLNDHWRKHGAPTLELVLYGMLKHHAPPPIKREATKLLELLKKPVTKMDDGERIDLSNELVGLLRFVCHRGSDDDA